MYDREYSRDKISKPLRFFQLSQLFGHTRITMLFRHIYNLDLIHNDDFLNYCRMTRRRHIILFWHHILFGVIKFCMLGQTLHIFCYSTLHDNWLVDQSTLLYHLSGVHVLLLISVMHSSIKATLSTLHIDLVSHWVSTSKFNYSTWCVALWGHKYLRIRLYSALYIFINRSLFLLLPWIFSTITAMDFSIWLIESLT